MAPQIMPDVLTDEEMAELEASFSPENAPDVLSDEEMAQLEQSVASQEKEPSGASRSFENKLGPQRITSYGSYSVPALDFGPSYRERVKSDIEEQAQKDVNRQNLGGNAPLSITAGIIQSMAAPIRQAPGSYEIGNIIRGGMKKLAPKTPPPASNMQFPSYGTYSLPKQNIGEMYEKSPNFQSVVDIGTGSAEILPPATAAAKIGAPIIGKALPVTSKGFKSAAGRVQGTKVKINTPEFNKGAANELYTKYNVFGNAKSVKKQWQTKISDTYKQVKDRILNSETMLDPDNYTFVDDIFSQAERSAEKFGKSKTAVIDIKKELNKMRESFDEAYPEGKINLLETQMEKQVIGKKGDWIAEAGSRSGNPSAPVSAQAHNALYDAMKTVVENKGSPGIKELNKQLSEMIPMERAASKQVLVSNRKNLIPLDDYIGGLAAVSSAAHGNPLPAMLMGANILSKSPTTASLLNKTGTALEWLDELGKTEIRLPKIKNPLSNNKGIIGSSAESFIGTPAIRDPKTGKIYTGGWRGHKDAIIKGETSAVQERLKYEHFLDNSNKPTANVGFIDDSGNFISRTDAEKIMEMKQTGSLAQQFHNVGIATATAGAAAGGLYLKKKLGER